MSVFKVEVGGAMHVADVARFEIPPLIYILCVCIQGGWNKIEKWQGLFIITIHPVCISFVIRHEIQCVCDFFWLLSIAITKLLYDDEAGCGRKLCIVLGK